MDFDAPAPDSVLVLLDFQHEFLDDNGRMPVSRQQVLPTINAARLAIERYRNHGRPIVAIGNEFSRDDFVMNLLRRRASLKGSVGSKWDDRIPLAGISYLPKWAASAFVNPEFELWLRNEGIGEIALTGLFARVCVSATTKAALKRGFRVRLLTSAIACSNERTKSRALSRLKRSGALLAA
jgi:nicotinamidase-related amidase